MVEIQSAIAALVASFDRDSSFVTPRPKNPLPTPEERTLFDALALLRDCDESEINRVRDGVDIKSAYTLTGFAMWMALLAFRNRDPDGLSRSAVPLLIAAAKIDWRDLLGAVARYADGCRRCGVDPLELLLAHKHFADQSAWETIEQGFFGRDPEMQSPELFGVFAFDSPCSLGYASLYGTIK
jgi:hypothetical protein